jgi:hypothetical protein
MGCPLVRGHPTVLWGLLLRHWLYTPILGAPFLGIARRHGVGLAREMQDQPARRNSIFSRGNPRFLPRDGHTVETVFVATNCITLAIEVDHCFRMHHESRRGFIQLGIFFGPVSALCDHETAERAAQPHGDTVVSRYSFEEPKVLVSLKSQLTTRITGFSLTGRGGGSGGWRRCGLLRRLPLLRRRTIHRIPEYPAYCGTGHNTNRTSDREGFPLIKTARETIAQGTAENAAYKSAHPRSIQGRGLCVRRIPAARKSCQQAQGQ